MIKRIFVGFFLLVILMNLNLTGQSSGMSPSIKVKGLRDFAIEHNYELFLPQDEFEKDAEYYQRLELQKVYTDEIQNQFLVDIETRKTKKERLETERIDEEERLIQNKITESLEPVDEIVSSIGTYNAEDESFLIEVNYRAYTVNIPRSEARSFKEKYGLAKVIGYKRLNRDVTTFEYFNLILIHPITGSRFNFGPRKDTATQFSIENKKSVVPPDLTMRVAFKEPNGNGFLDANEKGRVKVSISNKGKGSAIGVFVKLDAINSDKEVFFESSKFIGEVPSGQTKATEFEMSASKSVSRTEHRIKISASESYGFPPDPVTINFETFPFIPPQLELIDFGVSTPNQANVIRPKTTTDIQLRIQNRGQGNAEDVRFSINLPTGIYFTPESRQDYSFSMLKPGEFKDLQFSFNTAKTVGKTIEIAIGFTEKSTTGKFPLDLEVAKPQQSIQHLTIAGQERNKVEFPDVAVISVDVEKDIPISGRIGKDDLAVVFGIESYKDISDVSFAKRDATWIKKYFENLLGIPNNRIYYKTDSDVGQAEFSKVFSKDGWLDKRVKAGKTNVYVYYAGHGAPDIKNNKAYLIPYDGDPNYASQTGYEINELYDQLSELGAASVTVFLDACFSGANRDNEMLLANARPVFIEVNASFARDVTVFSASGGTEISSAWPEKKHGLFTYFLMKGLKGSADLDGDKNITVGELANYVTVNVAETAGMLDREQNPGLQTLDSQKVIVSY